MTLIVRLLLIEAAKWHAERASDPASAARRLARFTEQYRTSETFRAEIDAGARAVAAEARSRRGKIVETLQ